MKRTRTYFQETIPVKKLKKVHGPWEDSMASQRIIDLSNKLYDCLSSSSSRRRSCRRRRSRKSQSQSFLECLQQESCTDEELKEIVQFQCDALKIAFGTSGGGGGTMLHAACLLLPAGPEEEEEEENTVVQVLEKLIDIVGDNNNNNTILCARDNSGMIPLHYAVLPFQKPQQFIVETLLNYDDWSSSKTSMLLMKDRTGNIPLHHAVCHIGMKETCSDTVRLLYNNCPRKIKKEILTSRNNGGHTPLEVACSVLHTAFPMLAYDYIQTCVIGGIPSWRRRLCEAVQVFQQMDSIPSDVFMTIFHETIEEYDHLQSTIIPLLELAVWKARWGLTHSRTNKKQRKVRWITSGAQTIAKGVAEYLGNDPVQALLLDDNYDQEEVSPQQQQQQRPRHRQMRSSSIVSDVSSTSSSSASSSSSTTSSSSSALPPPTARRRSSRRSR